MDDAQYTREFAIKSALIEHIGKTLNRVTIDQISDHIAKEMSDGPCAWAFGVGRDHIAATNEKAAGPA